MRCRLKHILLLVTLCIACFSRSSAQGNVPDAVERAALLAIFTNNMSGLDTTSANSWSRTIINGYPNTIIPGVSSTTGDITTISLDGRGLSGTFSSQITDLAELQYLSLSSNPLLDSIPDLSLLAKLKTLNLSNNDFIGDDFPAWVGQLSLLEQLYLSNCNYAGPIPSSWSLLSNLRYLYLAGNSMSMTNAIPNSFSYLDNLEYLDLSNCSLLPSSVSNGLTGLNRLQSLNLNSNPNFVDNGYFPDKLSSLPMLMNLFLRQNGFQQFPTSLQSLPSLGWMDLSDNNYSDSTRLGDVIDVLKNCNSLKTILLNNCQIKNLPHDFDDLSYVETIHLSFNGQLIADGCDELGRMLSLKHLVMTNCNLEDLPNTLRQSNTLEELIISHNGFASAPTEIKRIQHLKVLDISHNVLNQLPIWFGSGNMQSITELRMDYDSLKSLPDSITFLSNIRLMSVSHNQLTSWPAGFDSLRTMQDFNAGYNDLLTTPDMTRWSSLINVDLQHNNLKGIIPKYLTQTTSNKAIVRLNHNKYNSVEQDGYFASGAPQLVLSNNQLTFESISKLKPPGSGYVFAPQDTIVDVVRELRVIQPAPITMVARADTASVLNCKFQWFRYVDGVNDVALNSSSHQDYTLTFVPTESDQGAKFYYKITNDILSGLTIKSHLITVIIICDVVPSEVTFTSENYQCATAFNPTVVYENGCRTKSIDWDFGDGATSSDKRPLHAYGGSGSFVVKMNLRYTCGICIRDTVVTKAVTYNPSQDLLKDSIIYVPSVQRLNVIAASAATFSDSWQIQTTGNFSSGNTYLQGTEGIWRNNGTYVYQASRHRSTSTTIATDGTFSLDQFNWPLAEVDAIPGWTKANTMTEYSPYSYELENRDVLGVYSAALYDYGGHLPSANGVNMRNREMAFTGFEYFDNHASGNWIFGTQPTQTANLYDVYSGESHIAIVKASQADLENVTKVDVTSNAFGTAYFRGNLIRDNEIVCIQPYPNNPDWTIIVLRKEPNSGVWTGKIKVRNTVTPVVSAEIDTTFAHTGRSSLKVSTEKTFKQDLLQLDSGKTYYVNAWVSVKNPHVTIPVLAEHLGIQVTLKDKNGVASATPFFTPSGKIIEGWQQVKGSFIVPDKNMKLEVTFKPGSNGLAWYDDLRLHPENGNMKSYVYDLKDYRLRAILDEENFASLFYYDQEGNLYTTKKETEEGVKTISESNTYMKQDLN